MYSTKTLVHFDYDAGLPPWHVTSYCLVFQFLNLADLSEMWELAATVACRQNGICPFAWTQICLPPLISGETQSSTGFGPLPPGLTAPVWTARQLSPPGGIQLRRPVRLDLPALLPAAQLLGLIPQVRSAVWLQRWQGALQLLPALHRHTVPLFTLC